MGGETSQKFLFRCYGCDNRFVQIAAPYRCYTCGEPVGIESTASMSVEALRYPPASMWHYLPLLPIEEPGAVVTLGEGATPLVEAPRLAASYGFSQLFVKNETANPTGSFKDRQVSVGITRARELRADTVAVVSSGNVACAASAYAARAGLRAVLFMHGHAASQKILQASSYGATCVRVQSPSAAAVFDLCVEACRTYGWYHLSTAGMYEPFNVEGAKTIAYELYQQTNGSLPDCIVSPVGGGGLLGGVWRGLLDLQRIGAIDNLPCLVGVQAAGCAPLVHAIQQNRSFLDTLKEPWTHPHTIAGGIADDILFDGHTVLPAIRRSSGLAISVTDDEILRAELQLARTEGLLCEPSSAAAFAALDHLRATFRDKRVCVIMTGIGIKDLAAIQDHLAPVKSCCASLKDLADVLKE